jgi:hypothetical protein
VSDTLDALAGFDLEAAVASHAERAGAATVLPSVAARGHAGPHAARGLALAALTALLVAPWATAQLPDPAEMQRLFEQLQADPQRVQRLLGQAQAMEACAVDLDEPALARVRTRIERSAGELHALCAAGQRDAAAQRAVELARELGTAPEVTAVATCAELARELLADPPFALPGESGDAAPAHVCEQLPE